MIKLLGVVLLVMMIAANVISSTENDVDSLINKGDEFIIDFDMVKNFDAELKAADEGELNTAFKLYIDSTGFDEMVERYSENVHEALTKRLKDSLIII